MKGGAMKAGYFEGRPPCLKGGAMKGGAMNEGRRDEGRRADGRAGAMNEGRRGEGRRVDGGHFEGRYLEAQEREFFDGNLFSDVRALC